MKVPFLHSLHRCRLNVKQVEYRSASGRNQYLPDARGRFLAGCNYLFFCENLETHRFKFGHIARIEFPLTK
jgi:hypothetical protein